MSGPTGSGKTTFCSLLQRVAEIRRVSPDEVRVAFVDEHNRANEVNVTYQNTFPLDVARHADRHLFDRLCRERVSHLLRSWAESEYAVLYDDVNLRAAERTRLVAILRAHGRPVAIVALHASKDWVMERLKARDAARISVGLPPLNIPEFVVDDQIATFEVPTSSEADLVHVIPENGEDSLDAMADEVRTLAARTLLSVGITD